MDIGTRIRKVRLAQQRTLADIAEACGCTRSLLSKIENGHSQPPLATLSRIAEALGVAASSLLEDGNDTGTVMEQSADMNALTATDEGYQFFTIAGKRIDKQMQPYLFVANKGDIKQHTLSHDGEEFIFIIEGQLRYRVGTTTYTLSAGDTLYFDSVEEHAIEPISATVRYLGVFCNQNVQRRRGRAKGSQA